MVTEKQLQLIEEKLKELDLQIAYLENLKDELLPEDYRFYRDEWYPQFYGDEPLAMRSYYRMHKALEDLNKKFQQEADIEVAFQKYGKELQRLERLLAI